MTRTAATLLLLAATCFWGSTFVVVKDAITRVGVKVLVPTHIAVIMCLEPVFAAGWAHAVAHERLTMAGYAGAGMIIVAMLLAEVVVDRGRALGRRCRL